MNPCSFDGLTGRVITKDSPFYNEARQVYNRAIECFPIAIVYCQNQGDISNAVIWARAKNIPFRIRNGGHNYEGFSTGNHVLVIDVSEMNLIILEEESKLVTIEGGVNNQELYKFLADKGYPFPGGTCPSVGVCGYSSGGGWGLSCRRFGLGCDSLLSLSLIDYNGECITASKEENPELFWACRGGGGGNFGVIISMTFKLPPKTSKVTLIEIKYPQANHEKQALFLLTWQDWLLDADKRITLVSRIYNSIEEGLAILSRGIYYGPPESALSIISPLLQLGEVKYTLKYLTFLEAVTRIGEFYPPSETFLSASSFAVRDLTDCEGYRVANLINDLPKGSVYTGLSLYALGGKVSEIEQDETAFYYRHAKYIIWLETIFENRKRDNAAWLKEKYCYLSSVTKGSYVNFPYDCLSCYKDAYYSSHICRLKKVKEAYDPCNVFSFPQSI